MYKLALAVLENVAAMARFREGGATALERALACLQGMGYQVPTPSCNPSCIRHRKNTNATENEHKMIRFPAPA